MNRLYRKSIFEKDAEFKFLLFERREDLAGLTSD